MANETKPGSEAVIEALCQSLALAHDEILKLQNVPEAERANLDWPEWSHPANSIRWAERLLGRSLSKAALSPAEERG